MDKSPRMFGHNVALHIYYTFLYFVASSNKRNNVGSIITQLARHSAYLTTEMPYLTEWKRREAHRQKMYADTYATYATAATRHLVEHASSFLNARDLRKLHFAPAQYNIDCVEP